MFYNIDLLRSICKSDIETKIRCNAGSSTENVVEDLPGYGAVWYQSGPANMLSLANNSTLKAGRNLRAEKIMYRGRD